MNILVVDNSLEVQQRLSGLLASVPNVRIVGCAEDVTGALALIESHRPEVVVLDVELRGKDRGFEVLRHVMHEHPDIKVIMLSNFSWQSMRAGFLANGAHAYFDKANEFPRARDCIAALAAEIPTQIPSRPGLRLARRPPGPAVSQPGR